MVHFPALPGSPLYDEKKGLDFIYSSIEADLINLQKAGVDAIMFGNENDRPYELNVNKATLSTMALKASGWFMARSARTLRFSSIPLDLTLPIKAE